MNATGTAKAAHQLCHQAGTPPTGNPAPSDWEGRGLQQCNETPNGFLLNEGFLLINSRAELSKHRRWPHKCLSSSA